MKRYKYNGIWYNSYKELAEAVGIPPYLLYNRLSKRVPIEKAISTPRRDAHRCASKPITIDGVTFPTQREAMEAYGINVSQFYRTLKFCNGDKVMAFKECLKGEKIL